MRGEGFELGRSVVNGSEAEHWERPGWEALLLLVGISAVLVTVPADASDVLAHK